jgi:hypothetical protein
MDVEMSEVLTGLGSRDIILLQGNVFIISGQPRT